MVDDSAAVTLWRSGDLVPWRPAPSPVRPAGSPEPAVADGVNENEGDGSLARPL